MFKVLSVCLAIFSSGALLASDEIPISRSSLQPGASLDWMGSKTFLLGKKGFSEGSEFPAVRLVKSEDMQEFHLKTLNKVTVITTLPSIDTPVCDEQVRTLNRQLTGKGIEVIVISRDLPYAQRRFSEVNKLQNIRFLSDYRRGEFGKLTGLEIERNGLLARSIMVVDEKRIVRHLQIVPAIYSLPDLEKAISVAQKIKLSNN